jgi:hypothetical protein
VCSHNQDGQLNYTVAHAHFCISTLTPAMPIPIQEHPVVFSLGNNVHAQRVTCEGTKIVPWVIYRLVQMKDRWEKVLRSQSDRQRMLGIIMGKDCIELLRFCRDSSKIERSGLQDFKWAAGNIGWQASYSYM